MHKPVLVQEIMELLAVRPGGVYLDCTLGGGGHTRVFLERVGPEGQVVALDRDQRAVDRAEELVAESEGRLVVRNLDFAELDTAVSDEDIRPLDGILFDFGISSIQLDNPERGFTFQEDGPLDMRMNQQSGVTAGELLDQLDEQQFVRILRDYADERDARRISRAVLTDREAGLVETTRQLADLVERVKGGRRGRIHPATKTFMALRMAVNEEPDRIERGLEAAFNAIRPGGRIAAMSFHSFEDRLVKRCFSAHVGRRESLQAGGDRWVGTQPEAEWIQRKPLLAKDEETVANPRARSARLRVVERKAD